MIGFCFLAACLGFAWSQWSLIGSCSPGGVTMEAWEKEGWTWITGKKKKKKATVLFFTRLQASVVHKTNNMWKPHQQRGNQDFSHRILVLTHGQSCVSIRACKPTHTPHIHMCDLGEGSAIGGRTIPFPSKSHRVPSCTIFLPVSHCLPGILEIVMGRWMTRFICQKERNGVCSSRLRLIEHTDEQFEDGIGNSTQACSFFLQSTQLCDSWSMFSVLKCAIEIRKWSHFQGQEHVCWENVHADLLCWCHTCLLSLPWWIQIHHCSAGYHQATDRRQRWKRFVFLSLSEDFNCTPAPAEEAGGSMPVRSYSCYWSLLQRPAASMTSSLCSQPSIMLQ